MSDLKEKIEKIFYAKDFTFDEKINYSYDDRKVSELESLIQEEKKKVAEEIFSELEKTRVTKTSNLHDVGKVWNYILGELKQKYLGEDK